jgi:hypothetical protein
MIHAANSYHELICGPNRYITKYHSVRPLVGIGTPPPLSPTGEGLGSPNSDDWRKSFALCLLYEVNHMYITPQIY